MISPEQTLATLPPEIPITPLEETRPISLPVPIIYDESSAPMEYKVLTRSSLEGTGLEADLNALGCEGWWLVQILPHEKQALIVLMRRMQKPGRSSRR